MSFILWCDAANQSLPIITTIFAIALGSLAVIEGIS